MADDLGAGGTTAHVAWNTDGRRRDRFQRLVLPHLDAGYALARWMTRNEADASDVVQEAFLRALRYFDSYRNGDARSWLLRIVRRTCYAWLARNRPADVVSFEDEAEFGEAVATALTDGEALLESRADLRRLGLVIESLPTPLRETIVLRELHELGYREIAEVTEVPIGTVMSRLYRGRSQLLRAFDGTAASSAALPGQVVCPRHRSPAGKSSSIHDVPRDVQITSNNPAPAH